MSSSTTQHSLRSLRSATKRRSSSSPFTDQAAMSSDTKPKPNKRTNVAKKPDPQLASRQSDKWYQCFTKGDEDYERYMEDEWGKEKHGDVPLFEKISLEGAQSGLSWLTILRKRSAYRSTFHNFDPTLVASMTSSDVDRILAENPKDTRQVIVRHRGKIESVISNANCVLQMRADHENATHVAESGDVLDHFLWSFVQHKPILNSVNSMSEAPTKSEESEAMSKALKKRGFKFVGPTTCYALMQATGMVIDHLYDTPEWHQARQRLMERPGGYQDRTKQE